MGDEKREGHPRSIPADRSMAAYVTEGSPVQFGDIEVANFFFKRFHNKPLPNVCNVVWANSEPVLWLEKGFVPFDPHKKLKFSVWKYSRSGKQIISMGRVFVKLFNGIKTGLKSLYGNDWHHGDLLTGVAVSKDFDVRLFNIGKQDCDMSKGVEKDLKDLMMLVQIVINNNPDPNGCSVPDCVSFFLQLDDVFETIVLDASIGVTKWKFKTYFIFNSPIFADQKDRIVLIKKLINLRNIFEVEMDDIFAFKNPPAAMNEWWMRLTPNTYLHNTSMIDMFVYMKDIGTTGEKRSIIAFYKSCFRHKNVKTTTNRIVDEVAVEVSLTDLFPDFLPKAYYVFIRELAWKLLPEADRSRYNSYFDYFQMAEPQIAL